MIGQQGNLASSTLSSAIIRAAVPDHAAEPNDRKRRLWDFYVWSFFVSQLMGGVLAAGGPAQAASDGETAPADPEAASSGVSSGDQGPGSVATSNEPDAQQLAASQAAAVLARAEAVAQAEPSPDAGGAGRAGESVESGLNVTPSGSMLAELHADGTSPQALGQDHSGGDTAAPGIVGGGPLLDVGGLPDIGGLLPDIVDVVDDVAGTSGDLLEQVLSPVLETADDLLSTVGHTVDGLVPAALGATGDILDALGGALDDIFPPLIGAVGDVLDGVGDGVGAIVPAVLDAADDILDATGDAASNIVSTALDATDDVLDGVGEGVGTLVPAVLGAADDILDAAGDTAGQAGAVLSNAGKLFDDLQQSAESAVASGGVLDFVSRPVASEIAIDALFAAGQYTHYNMFLQLTADVPAQDAGEATSGVASLLDQLTDGVETVTGESAVGNADQDVPAALPHGIGGLLPLGLGEWI